MKAARNRHTPSRRPVREGRSPSKPPIDAPSLAEHRDSAMATLLRLLGHEQHQKVARGVTRVVP